MVDQRRQIIDEIHKLNILLIHTKLKTTRGERFHGPSRPNPSKPMFICSTA